MKISINSVKITTRKLSEVFCPHYCMGCGTLGAILCENCKNYNECDGMGVCLGCGAITKNGHCGRCKLPFERGFTVGRKEDGVLWRCVNEYKYKSVRALHVPLAGMLDATLPCLPMNTVAVPVPTNYRHVRGRGLDHTWLLGKELARMRGWECKRIIKRVKNSVQVGTDAKTRAKQAKEAYGLNGEISDDVPYVVVDDVWTTGSTMKAVCEMLKKAGAKDVTAIVLVRA